MLTDLESRQKGFAIVLHKLAEEDELCMLWFVDPEVCLLPMLV